MLQVFSASLPLSQSSRRLTPSQEVIVTSREDGETEQEYIRARPEGDIYVNSGIVLMASINLGLALKKENHDHV